MIYSFMFDGLSVGVCEGVLAPGVQVRILLFVFSDLRGVFCGAVPLSTWPGVWYLCSWLYFTAVITGNYCSNSNYCWLGVITVTADLITPRMSSS